MTNIIEISEDAFAALYKPIANHLNPNASYDWGDGHGTLFETYDEELAYVQSQEPARIWTVIDGDDGKLTFMPNVDSILEDFDAAASVWDIHDVLEICPKLSREDALLVLRSVTDRHDSNSAMTDAPNTELYG